MNAFDDRRHAGKALAEALRERPMHEPLLLALPRGGVPVAYEISLALQYPLELMLVRKIGAPGHEEYAVGAVVEGDPPRWVKDEDLLRQLRLAPDWFERRLAEQLREIERRRARYGGQQPLASRRGRDLILVDDGLATGNSVRAALQALREDDPRRIILAVPVGPPATVEKLRPLVDELVCLLTPEDFHSVGHYYRDFHQLDDQEVVDLLRPSRTPSGA
ncbi:MULTISPECIES: phosphoribosyltransferase [unclassified Pseudomonas]|jgi:predicted phosphoribosyltransferase|uniref:phosphoribosyltransferase n=1 Tax=unclassified Pseudomonas TaxID=196821 RepID=UPI00073164E7|nr:MULTISPECIES: phosphoribosyltransferase [unclassified Pseudomonas]KSW27568.1 phosphoribosyltransferase [Pseudomonas sp. ADP]OBP08812.1 phosphoribosyltransferase [Pseudomonas sp. EGD-AKN5]QOF84232.1 phosphoribosyltransferase [Pseudomonas sp. ADPe]